MTQSRRQIAPLEARSRRFDAPVVAIPRSCSRPGRCTRASMRLYRRDLLKAATAAFALSTLPVIGACTKEGEPPAIGVFRHGVASGDPLPDAVFSGPA